MQVVELISRPVHQGANSTVEILGNCPRVHTQRLYLLSHYIRVLITYRLLAPITWPDRSHPSPMNNSLRQCNLDTCVCSGLDQMCMSFSDSRKALPAVLFLGWLGYGLHVTQGYCMWNNASGPIARSRSWCASQHRATTPCSPCLFPISYFEA